MAEHEPTCPLHSVHWLRHAVAAAGRLAQDHPDPDADRTSAMSLVDALAHFAELEDWCTVTLSDVAEHATLMNQDHFKSLCNCGALS